MRFHFLLYFFILTLSIFLLGCSGETPSPGSKDKGSANTNRNTARGQNRNTKNPLETAKTPRPNKEIKEAETLKPIVNAYCAAINNGDDQALRKIFTQAAWKSLAADARSEGKNSVAKYLVESEPIGNECRVINERIVGNTAEAVVITESYPNGVPLKFVKEGGGWKWTNQSSDFDAVRKKSGK